MLLELLVLIMEALLPEENLFEALVQTSHMDCVHSVESKCVSQFLGAGYLIILEVWYIDELRFWYFQTPILLVLMLNLL